MYLAFIKCVKMKMKLKSKTLCAPQNSSKKINYSNSFNTVFLVIALQRKSMTIQAPRTNRFRSQTNLYAHYCIEFVLMQFHAIKWCFICTVKLLKDRYTIFIRDAHYPQKAIDSIIFVSNTIFFSGSNSSSWFFHSR